MHMADRGALIITYTILGVPYYLQYNGPQNPILTIEAPILVLQIRASFLNASDLGAVLGLGSRV